MGRIVNTAAAAAIALGLILSGPAYGQSGGENGGLGPFAVRSFFPPTLPYLDFTPDQALTIPDGALRVTYQFAVTSTFINSQTAARIDAGSPIITPSDVDAGLTAANFLGTGYGLYIDVEMERHLFEFKYGLTDSLELGLELAWISLGGGSLDDLILEVEETFNAVNTNREAADRDGFDYFVIFNGQFIRNTSRSINFEPQDPVLNLKWNLAEGGDFLPSFSVKFSYKLPLSSEPNQDRSLISSGNKDFGYSVLLGKRFGFLIAHYQLGKVRLKVPGGEFETERKFRMFALELQADEDNAFVGQLVSQSNLFKRDAGGTRTSINLDLAKDTELVTIGYKHGREGFLLEVGFTEDVNSTINEADVTLFLELGWQW